MSKHQRVIDEALPGPVAWGEVPAGTQYPVIQTWVLEGSSQAWVVLILGRVQDLIATGLGGRVFHGGLDIDDLLHILS